MLVEAGANVLAKDERKTAQDLARSSKHHDCDKYLAKCIVPMMYASFMNQNKELFPNLNDTLQKLKKLEKVFLPDIFKCAITGVLCNDPVVVDDGYIYERAALMEHLKTDKNSPKTRQTLYFADKPQAMTVYKKMIADIIHNEVNNGDELPEHCKCPLDDYRYYNVVLCNDGYLYNKRGLELNESEAPATRSGKSLSALNVGRKIDMYEIQLAISDYDDIVKAR